MDIAVNLSAALYSMQQRANPLRTFAPNFSNIDFFLEILPLKDDELVMSENCKKMGGHRICFGENLPRGTPKIRYL